MKKVFCQVSRLFFSLSAEWSAEARKCEKPDGSGGTPMLARPDILLACSDGGLDIVSARTACFYLTFIPSFFFDLWLIGGYNL
ncbi:MAG: hypothetical protein K6E78_01145 [Treponema sp.]|nr:hypothetical protein [Treponema sp.]